MNYSILAAAFGHFFLLSHSAKQFFDDFFQIDSGHIVTCHRFLLTTETKLMVLYYAFFCAGIASIIIKTCCPSFIQQYTSESAFQNSSLLSNISELKNHFQSFARPLIWRKLTKRSHLREIDSIRAEAEIILSSRLPSDHAKVCHNYKAAFYKLQNRSFFWAPLGNILITTSFVLLLATTLSMFTTVSCVLGMNIKNELYSLVTF